jgi:Flp pilus assembly protein TadD
MCRKLAPEPFPLRLDQSKRDIKALSQIVGAILNRRTAHALAGSALAAVALIGAGLSPAAAGPVLAGATAEPEPTPAAVAKQPVAPAPAPTPPPPRRKATAQEREQADRLEPLARAAFWAREADVDPTDQVAGVRLASALRGLGQYAEAVASAQRVLVLAPDNTDALLETARAFIAEGQGFYAVEPAQKLHKLTPKDWRPLSLLGVAYAQVRRGDDAMVVWRQALQLSHDNPAVLSNMAMELAARGEAPQAETLLRRAVAQPGASLQVRQDLTLVLGLEGKLGEAEHRLREDLPPEQADADLAYLKAVSASAGAANPAAAPSPNRSPAPVKGSGG